MAIRNRRVTASPLTAKGLQEISSDVDGHEENMVKLRVTGLFPTLKYSPNK